MVRTSLWNVALWSRKLWSVALVGALPCLLSGVALAQILPGTQLTTIFPPGGKQGTSVDVTIAGVDLDGVNRLFFSHAGLTAVPKVPAPTEADKTPKPLPNQFVVQIAPTVPAGVYEARIVGRFGVSNPRAFVVGDKPETLEVAGNNSVDKAAEFAIGSTINARTDANSIDYYKLTLKAGQRVLADCWAQRIDSRMDATLVITDAAGKELARNRDSLGSDSLVDFTAPADGAYILKVYDFVYGGGAEHPYRLTVHSGPQVDFIFPPSGLPGSNGQYTVYGRNLPGGQPAEGVFLEGKPLQKVAVSIALPADEGSKQQLALGAFVPPRGALLDAFEYLLPGANPAPVYFARAPVVVEVEPNNASAMPQKVEVPCEFVGQFYPARDVDWVEFSVKKGDVYFVEAISHQLGLDCDPLLILQKVTKNDKGEEVLTDVAQVDDPGDRNTKIGTDFDTSTDDPSYRIEANEDTTYRLMIRDQFGDSRQDPRSIYRLVIRRATPDFRLVAFAQPLKNGADQAQQQQVPLAYPVLRRGGTSLFAVTVDRRDGFQGEITVSAEGLPPGVTCPSAVLGGSVESATLVLSAADDAAPWSGTIRLVGKAQINGQEAVRVARSGTVVWGTANRQASLAEFRLARDIALAVMDKETWPARVQAGEDQVWESSLGGNVEIPVTLVRRPEFKDPIKLVAVGLPNEIKPKEINLDANTAAGKLEIPLTVQAIKPGTYTFYLRSDIKIKHVRNPDAVTEAEAEKAQVDQLVAQAAEGVKTTTAAKDAATKAAADAAAAAKTAETNKTAAAAAAKAAADAAKAALDKAVAAKDAAGKDAANKALEEAATAAQKASDDAAAASKAAAETLTAAEQVHTAELAKAKAADEAKVASEKALKEAQDKVTATNAQKAAADKKVADAKAANAPKDANVAIASTPIKLRIVATPIGLVVPPPAAPVKQTEKGELNVTLNRLYGFADAVELTFEPPAGVAGLTAAKITVAKDQPAGKFEIVAAANATPGDHPITIRAKAKFNNVNVETVQQVVVKVEAKQ